MTPATPPPAAEPAPAPSPLPGPALPPPPAATRADAAKAGPRQPIPTPPASGSWETLLAWCRTALSADAAFVIDELGLLVANSGRLSDEEAQAMGARLVVAVDHADELERGSPVRTITFDLSSHCLTGVRLQLNPTARLTVGVVSLRPLSASAGALVRKAFASKLGEG